MDELSPPDAAPAGLLATLGRAVAALTAQLRALLFPDRGIPPLVAAGRARLAMAIVVGAALVSASARATHLELGPEVRAENAGRPPGPKASTTTGRADAPGEMKTDRQLDQEVDRRTAVLQVKLGLGAALWTPIELVAIAVFLFLLGGYVGGSPTFARTLAASSVGALPWAVHDLIAAVVAWQRGAVGSAELNHLVDARLAVGADHPLLARLAGRIDLFVIWSVVLWGLGLAAAAGLGRARAMITVVVGCTLYLLVATAGA